MSIKWQSLNRLEQVEAIVQASHKKPQVIFKHSTTCGISAMMKAKFEETWNIENDSIDTHYLDLLTYREISNHIAQASGIYHQSPQMLLFKDGKVLLDASHHSINVEAIKKALV